MDSVRCLELIVRAVEANGGSVHIPRQAARAACSVLLDYKECECGTMDGHKRNCSVGQYECRQACELCGGSGVHKGANCMECGGDGTCVYLEPSDWDVPYEG